MKRWAHVLYRLALRTLPRPVREAVGGEMERTFLRLLARARRRGRWAEGSLVLREVVNVLVVALTERGTFVLSLGPLLQRPLRRLIRSPGYGLAAVGTLAPGVGVAVSMFTVVDMVVLRPLPFPDADRLVHVWRHTSDPENTVPGATNRSFLVWRELTGVFTDLEGFHRDTRVLTGSGDPEQIRVALVTPGLLDLLGIAPVRGRGFEDAGGTLPATDHVIVGHELWVRRFGGDAALLGRTLELDGRRRVVVGIMPAGLGFPDRDIEAWIPVAPTTTALTPDTGPPVVPSLDVLARLRPGLDREEANAALLAREDELAEAGAPAGEVPQVFDLGFFLTPERTRDTLVLLLAAVVLVLLVAGANVASLGLSRAVSRRSELAVRRALGAGRASVLGELLAENLALALVGSALGVLVAHGLLSALVPMVPDQIGIRTWGRPLTVWPHGLQAAVLVALVAAPVLTVLTWRPGTRSSGPWIRAVADPPGAVRLQQLLVVAQVGFAALLLGGGALVGGSVVRLHRVDTGMDVGQLLVVGLRIPTDLMLGDGSDVPDADRAARLDARFQELADALRQVPGVASVASTTSPLPLTRARFRPELETVGRPPLPRSDFIPISEVSEGFFETAGIPLLEGRPLDASDAAGSAVIVNEVVARRLWPDRSAVGRSLRLTSEDPWWTVVGVAAPTVQMSLRDAWGEGGELYLPLDRSRFGVYRTFVVRAAAGDPPSLVPGIRAAVRAVDPGQPIERLLPLSDAYAETVLPERFFLTLLGLYSLLATVLAALGIYAVVTDFLSRRVRELGVRVALGARPLQIAARVGRAGLGPAVIGVVVGSVATWPLSRLLEGLLFGVAPGDPPTLAGAAVVLTSVALGACLPTARRALGASVIEVLKAD